MSERLQLACALLALGACTSRASVPFRVVALGDDPFFAGTATAIAVTMERDGVREPGTTVRFAPDATALTLPPMPFGNGYAVIVETELSGLVLARGRSFPFDVSPAGASHSPDVSLGVLGRFAPVATGDASDPYLAVVPSADGALLASAAGLTRFVAHGPGGLPAIEARTPWPAPRIGGAAVALDRHVLVVGGAAPGASLVDARGAVIAEIAGAELPIVDGAAIASVDAATVLVVGGTRSDGSLAPDVTRVEWDGAHLIATALAPLQHARTAARAVPLLARRRATPEPRVLVLDGRRAASAAPDLVLLDPSGQDAPRSVVVPGLAVRAAACALDTGLVLLAGGVDATGAATGQLTLLVVQPDAAPGSDPIAALSPAPPPLFRARESAGAIALGPGLALIVAGRDAAAAPVAEAEIAEIQLDSLPGSVVLTGTLASAGNVTAAAPLSDHTFLVSSDGALSLYFSPRGE